MDLIIGVDLHDVPVRLVSLDKAITKTGKDYLRGSFVDLDGKTHQFNIWSTDYEDCIVGGIYDVSANVRDYQGNPSLTVFALREHMGDKKKSDFLVGDLKESLEFVFNDFIIGLNRPKVKAVIDMLFSNKGLKDRFFFEYAAVSMHDAKPYGLANHTLKMLEIGKVVIEQQKRIGALSADEEDIILLGIVLHDLGKVYEYSDGMASDVAFLGHRYFGLLLLGGLRDKVVELYSMDFYNMLVSVVLQHHGAYGERPTTIYAYIVHCLDMLESQVTGILEQVNSGGNIQGRLSNGESIRLIKLGNK